MSMTFFQMLNGATFAALLFVVASGFTLIFGLMRIVNLAHGALYLMGGYIGYSVGIATGNFFLSAVAAALGIALIGLIIDIGLLRFIKTTELRQVLLTLGVAFVLNDIALVIWGGDAFSVPVPQSLQGPSNFEVWSIRSIDSSSYSWVCSFLLGYGSCCIKRGWVL